MECKREETLRICGCSYGSCSKRGVCCDCIQSHLKRRQLPGCCFPASAEKTYDRSFEHFARLLAEEKI